MKKTIIFTIGGILIFLFGFLAGGYWTALKIAGVSEYIERSPQKAPHTMVPENDFWESIFWGAKWENIDNMKPVPEGKGYLRGKFLYNGKPAKGIRFKLFLNSKFRTASIVTDDNGSFEVRLPEGVWYVNMLQCEGWGNKPDGNFILISGDELTIDNSSFQDLFFHSNENGKKVEISNKRSAKEQIILTIAPRIKSIWPKESLQNQQATIAGSVIQWEPYPSAAVYVLKIDKVTRGNEKSTTFTPILYRKVSGTSLPLKDLQNSKGSEIEEYAVTIRAYDDAGTLISESESLSLTFSLSDGNALFSEQL